MPKPVGGFLLAREVQVCPLHEPKIRLGDSVR
jgi:hypothetical protein